MQTNVNERFEPMQQVRPLTVWLSITALVAGLVTWLCGAIVPTSAGFADLLVAGCALTGALTCLWLWVLVTLVLLDAHRGRAARPGVPAGVRRLVLAAAGIALTGGLAVPAGAAEPGADGPVAPGPEPGATAAVLVGLPLPDRTTTTSAWLGRVLERPAHPGPARGTSVVTVAPGDTLWGLARDTLPGTPDEREVERAWRELYAANRATVGADPDLIRPGQRLVLPGPDEA